MKRVETVTESEAVVTVWRYEWHLTGWKADLLLALVCAPVLFFLAVGVTTFVGWFA